VTEMWVFSTKW